MWQNFLEGIRHITDIDGYDHMLFLLALCAPFTIRQWKPVVFLATAFTIGHSISLALSAFDIIRFSSGTIEFLIAVTIFITSLNNILFSANIGDRVRLPQYILTVAFGLIHGMGFSSFFRMMYGDNGEMVKSLLAFNIGVEVGQLIIIVVYFILSFLLLRIPIIKQSRLRIALSAVALVMSVVMITERC